MKRATVVSIMAVGLLSAAAFGDLPVVTGDGDAFDGGFSSLSREADRVLQQFYDASYFSSITSPAQITAMSFRLPAVADVDYPTNNDITFGRYEITLAKPSAAVAAANGLTSATFADNMDSPMQVRTGSLTIPQESFISNASGVDADFSFVITFDTPYTYMPGDDLVMLVRHNGHGDTPTLQTRWNFDSYAWAGGTIVSTGNVDDAVANLGPGVFDTANKIQFLPEPSTVMLLALGALATVRRRRL